jgi:ADP-ribosylglycohydrolase/protein-glutamine gamma-glutamyltransferase-like protein
MDDSRPTLTDRFVGCLLGLAIGDALGANFEGQSPEHIARRYRTVDRLITRPPPGELWYTDDTQMTIGVAETLVVCKCIDEAELCRRFSENYQPQRGYGRGARVVLDAMVEGRDHRYLAANRSAAGGNEMGSLRLAPGPTNRTKTLTPDPCRSRCAIAVIIAAALCLAGAEQGPGDSSSDPKSGVANLSHLLNVARDELHAAQLSEREIQLRLKIIENVATVKAYFPHAYGRRPETRNSKYWVQNDEGNYVPRRKPTESIKDLWRTTSGIRCRKLSTLVMLKGLIDVADARQIGKLDEMLRGKVIPNDLPNEGIGTLFEELDPKQGEVFQNDEFLPGDEVWFDNPYFEQLSNKLQSRYRGQEGHHVFYIGGGNVMDMYSREPVSIDDFRETFLAWGSVKAVAKDQELEPKAEDFQIKAVRRVIFDGK